MKQFMLLVIGLSLVIAPLALAASPADVTQSPACSYCGMDRDKYVIPEAILIGNPASNRPKSWIPDKDIRG